MNRYAFHHAPFQSRLFDLRFSFFDFVYRPYFSIRNMMQGSNYPCAPALPYISQTNGIGWAKPAHGMLHCSPLPSSPGGGGGKRSFFYFDVFIHSATLQVPPPPGE